MIIENKTLFADNFNSAIIGTTDDGRIVYSKVLMVEHLVLTDGMSVEEAIEFLEYNTWCAHFGQYTPIYMNDFDADEDEVNEYIQRDARES